MEDRQQKQPSSMQQQQNPEEKDCQPPEREHLRESCTGRFQQPVCIFHVPVWRVMHWAPTFGSVSAEHQERYQQVMRQNQLRVQQNRDNKLTAGEENASERTPSLSTTSD